MEKAATQWMFEPLRKYAIFDGRARRAEYWWFQLFSVLVGGALAVVDMSFFGVDRSISFGVGPLGGLFALAVLIPDLAVAVRRLHDTDRSGWWLLLLLVPLFGALVLLFWFVQRGTAGENRFGRDPIAA